MEAIEDYGKKLGEIDVLDKKDRFDTYDGLKDNLLFLGQKEILNQLYNKRFLKTDNLNDQIDCNNLRYKSKPDK